MSLKGWLAKIAGPRAYGDALGRTTIENSRPAAENPVDLAFPPRVTRLAAAGQWRCSLPKRPVEIVGRNSVRAVSLLEVTILKKRVLSQR